MFETQETTPWYRSMRNLLLVGVPSLAVAAAICAYLFSGFGSSNNEAHYAALEQHRAQQQQQPQPSVEASTTPNNTAATSNTAVVQSVTLSSNAAQPQASSQAESARIVEEAHAVAAAAASPISAANVNAAQPVAKQAGATPSATRNYWTNFRGPNRDGRYDESEIKTNWASEKPPLLWRQPIGGGYASFVIADGTAFTIEQRRRQEVVAAYNVETGRELWTQSWNAEFVESMGGDGPRATPTWDAGRLYALGATGEFRCLDAKTGKVMWARNILTDNGAENLQWGMSASPLIVDDKVIVQPGGKSGKSIVAYNKLTGARIWDALNDTQAYTSPMLVTLAGRRQIISVTASRVVGLAIEDGSLLWSYGWNTQMGINISQPIVVDKNRFFISAGYGKGATLVSITASGNNLSAEKVWENSLMKNKFNSSVLHNGHIYGLDEGILTCVDVETGTRKWKGGRYGYGQVLLASGHLIVTSDTGELVLVRATPEKHEELTKFSAVEGRTWNVPAIAGGRLLVRNSTLMACFNLSPLS